MADQSILLHRLRRLIDDAGHGHSQSAPGFQVTLASSGITDPAIGVSIDGIGPVDVSMGPIANLSTGMAISYAIQAAVRAADPGLLLPIPTPTEGWANFYCRFDRAEGYLLQSGSIGSHSEVHVTIPVTGTDVTSGLKLGLHNGGYEDHPKLNFTDEELVELLDSAINVQNRIGDITSWTYATLPGEYETVIVYRAWGDVIDAMLGRSANYYPQKVAGEEVGPHNIFANYMKLRKWLDDKIDELTDAIESRIQVTSVIRWDKYSGTYVGDNGYKPGDNIPLLLAALEGQIPTEVFVEFAQILTLDIKTLYLAYREEPGVFDRSLLTEEDFVDTVSTTALATGSTLARTLTQAKNTLVKVSGLLPETTYYFAVQLIDQNGNRYFSNELELTTSEMPT